MTRGPDGRIWFTEQNGKLGAIDTGTHQITEYTVNPLDCGLIKGLAAGGDGNMYATCQLFAYCVTTTGETLLEFLLPEEAPSAAQSTVEAPDGNVWISLARGFGVIMVGDNKQRIGFLRDPYGSFFTSIADGPDGNVWGTERNAAAVYLRSAIHEKRDHLILNPHVVVTLVTSQSQGLLLTATSSNPNVTSVSAGPSSNEFSVAGVSAGNATVVIADALGSSYNVPATVR